MNRRSAQKFSSTDPANTGRQAVEVAQQPVALGNACGNVGFEIGCPQHLDERSQRDRPFGVAPGVDDARLGLSAGELRGQPALADTGVADDGDQPGRPRRHRVVHRGLQSADFVGPADEGRCVGGARLASEPLVDGHGRGSALDLYLAEGLVSVLAAGGAPCLLADHDVAARALGLETCPDVQRVADEVGVARPDHNLAGVHCHAQIQLDPMGFGDLGGEVDEALLKLDRGVDGMSRRRRVRSRVHPRRP